jgi:iron complex outermembrane receptor protein
MPRTPCAPRLIALAVAAASLSLPAVPALAQERGFELEEIVVTARKREENLQDTPIAVSAFSGENLARRGIVNVADFNQTIPGIDVQNGSGVAGVANIYIRGVGQRNTEPNLDSGVGIYLDGVYISRADGALMDMNDVRSVQVLRGPQGTLFGKNTTGGAMLIETNRPSEEFEGKLSVTAGDYSRRNAAAVLNVPLVEGTLFTRLSLLSVKRDGYTDNTTLGGEYNDEDRDSAIWQLRWLPTENLTADLNLNWSETDQEPRGLQCVPSSTNFGGGWSSILQNTVVKMTYDGKTLEDFCLESAATEKDKIVQDLGGAYTAETQGASMTLNWDINDALSLKSISAWRSTTAGQSDDLDPLSIPYQHRTNSDQPFARDRETEQWSQEFDLTGRAFDDRLSYIAGLYYFTEETDQSRTVGLTGPWSLDNPAKPAGHDIIFYNGTGTDIFTDNEAWAAFLQGDWSLAEKWTLTAGIRYTSETREMTRNSYLPLVSSLSSSTAPLFGLPALGNVLNVASNTYLMLANTFNPVHDWIVSDVDVEDVDSDAWTPLVSVSYALQDVGFIETGSVYLTVSKGFRSGGLSEAPSADLEEFDPEEVISTEVGLKFDALDSRLRANIALFDLAYDDRQLTTIAVSPQGRIAGATINAKESGVRGMEIEGTFLPTEKLELTMSGSWYDDSIDEYEDIQLGINASTASGGAFVPSGPNCAASLVTVAGVGTVESCIIDRSDERLPRLPESTLMLAAQYYIDTAVGTFVPRLQWSKKYEVDTCFDRQSCVSGDYLNDNEDLSARVMWTSPDEGAWMVTAYMNNIMDEDYVIGGQPLYDAWGFGGYTYAAPRMYGAEVSYRW